MVKKPTAKASTNPEDSAADFYSDLKKKRKVVKAASNEEASSGFTDGIELAQLYKLRDKQTITTKARLQKVIVGKSDNGKYASFIYTILTGEGKGATPSKPVFFAPGKDEDEDEAFERAMKEIWFEIQHLGYETKGLDDEDLQKLIDEEINVDKPTVMLQIRGAKSKQGKNAGKMVGYVKALRPIELDSDDEDEEEEEGDEEEEDEEEEEEENPKKGAKKGAKAKDEKPKGKGGKKAKDEEEEEEEPEEEEEEEEDEGPDEDDPSTWVGYSVKYKPPKAKRAVVCVVDNFSRAKKILTLKDDKNDETYKVKADDEGIVGFA